MDRSLMCMKNFSPWGFVCPCPRTIYMHISIIMKHLLPWNCLANQSQTSYMEHPWEGGKKVYINGQGHMTKMAAMAINRKKPLKVFFSRTRRPMILRLGVKHQWLELYKVYIKSWPRDDIDLFYGKVNAGRSCIWMGKSVKMSFVGKNFQEMGKWT